MESEGMHPVDVLSPDFLEENQGLRLSWNTIPATEMQAKRLIVPIGAIYTPLSVPCEPMMAAPRTCSGPCGHSVLNPHWCAALSPLTPEN